MKLWCRDKVLVVTDHAYDDSGLKEKGERSTRWRLKEKKLASSIAASSLGFNVLRADPGIGKRGKKKKGERETGEESNGKGRKKSWKSCGTETTHPRCLRLRFQ